MVLTSVPTSLLGLRSVVATVMLVVRTLPLVSQDSALSSTTSVTSSSMAR